MNGTQEILDLACKNTTLEEIKNAITWTKKEGISTGGFFIMGLPNETEKTLKATIDFMLQLDLDEVHSGFFVPFPGTDFYEKIYEYGTFENNWQKMNGWIPVFVPKDLTKEKLELYNKLLFRKFYFRPRIVFNYITRIKSLTHIITYLRGFLSISEYLIKRRPN
jgi:anaerobic magnesium-protoporphyrin IX monomethyl ester cyclase